MVRRRSPRRPGDAVTRAFVDPALAEIARLLDRGYVRLLEARAEMSRNAGPATTTSPFQEGNGLMLPGEINLGKL